MRAVVQKVKAASVTVGKEEIAAINKGLVVFLGVEVGDAASDASYIAEKVVNLRIFEDEAGKMNKSLMDIGGELLVVSQFTIMGDVRKGKRPSFTKAAPPEDAKKLYNDFIEICRTKIAKVATGKFQAEMLVNILNEGPVTILLDSRKVF